MQIKFNAHRGNGIISRLIRLFSRGLYNHISIELDGYIYEAHIHTGVHKVLVKEWDAKTVVNSTEIDLSTKRFKETYLFLEKQVGKKYDLRGVLGFLFVAFKPRMGYFYCSELAIVALAKALGKKDRMNNALVSPHLFWDILLLSKKD